MRGEIYRLIAGIRWWGIRGGGDHLVPVSFDWPPARAGAGEKVVVTDGDFACVAVFKEAVFFGGASDLAGWVYGVDGDSSGGGEGDAAVVAAEGE